MSIDFYFLRDKCIVHLAHCVRLNNVSWYCLFTQQFVHEMSRILS